MDLAEISRVLGRRWYVLLPGLLLTAVLVVAASTRLPVTYQSQSTVALLNSEKATQAFDGNPFLSSQTSLTGMADMLARNLNSDASVAALRARGATGTPVAKIADNAQGPLLWLTVSGPDRHAVLRSDQLLTDYAAQRLRELQTAQAVASPARIRMVTIVPPQEPVAQLKTRYEYLALAGVAGVVLTLLAAFYTEARLRHRPSRSGGGPPPPAADGGAGPGPQADATRAGEPYLAPLREAMPADRMPSQTRTAGYGRAPHDDPATRGGAPAHDHTAAPGSGVPDRAARPAPRWSGPDSAIRRTDAPEDGAHRFV